MTFALQTSLLRVGMGSEARGEISVAFRRDKCGIHDASAHRIPRVGDATAETTIALGVCRKAPCEPSCEVSACVARSERTAH